MQATSEVLAFALSADDCKAIKLANRFVVRLQEGTAVLECIRRKSPSRDSVFTPDERAREERRTIACYAESTAIRATFVGLYPDGQWQALGLLVRPGDQIRLNARDNQNGYLKHAIIQREALDPQYHPEYHGIHTDECLLSIARPHKNAHPTNPRVIVRDMVMKTDNCPDNSARAIQRT